MLSPHHVRVDEQGCLEIHKDPFDRLLIAQAIEQLQCPLLTKDQTIRKYDSDAVKKATGGLRADAVLVTDTLCLAEKAHSGHVYRNNYDCRFDCR